MNTITNDLAVTINELSEFYEVASIYEYIIHSVINGQYGQARTLLAEARQMLDHSPTELKTELELYDEDTQTKIFKLLAE